MAEESPGEGSPDSYAVVPGHEEAGWFVVAESIPHIVWIAQLDGSTTYHFSRRLCLVEAQRAFQAGGHRGVEG